MKCKFFICALLALVSCKSTGFKYDASGSFEATEVIVSSEATGRLMKLGVEDGDKFTAGQEVGCIDTVQLYLKKEQLIVARRATQSREQDIAKQIASTEEQIVTQNRELRRVESLLKSDAATTKQRDDIESAIAVLQKQLVAQKSTLQNNNRGVSEEMKSYEVQIAQIEDQILKSHIISPITGTVLSKYAEQGEFTSVGKPLFKIADVENLFLRAYVTSPQLESLKLGQTVTVFADYGTDSTREYHGNIVWISDKAEFTPKNIQTKDERANLVYALKVAVKNDGFIKIGMYGTLNLQ